MAPPVRQPYLTDLTDAQWAILQPLVPLAKPGGRPREVDMREVINIILYLNRTGCQWDRLPHALLPNSRPRSGDRPLGLHEPPRTMSDSSS
jgi:transposase